MQMLHKKLARFPSTQQPLNCEPEWNQYAFAQSFFQKGKSLQHSTGSKHITRAAKRIESLFVSYRVFVLLNKVNPPKPTSRSPTLVPRYCELKRSETHTLCADIVIDMYYLSSSQSNAVDRQETQFKALSRLNCGIMGLPYMGNKTWHHILSITLLLILQPECPVCRLMPMPAVICKFAISNLESFEIKIGIHSS